MAAVKEMWELVSNWLGNGKKMIIGGIFFLTGLIWFLCTAGWELEHMPFLFMATGLMCMVNVIFSKATDNNINLFLFLGINIVFMLLAIFMEVGDDSQFAFMVGCYVFAWIFHSIVSQEKLMLKRVVISFFLTLLSLVAILIALFGPIMLQTGRFGV